MRLSILLPAVSATTNIALPAANPKLVPKSLNERQNDVLQSVLPQQSQRLQEPPKFQVYTSWLFPRTDIFGTVYVKVAEVRRKCLC